MATLNLLYRDIISSGWTREIRKQLAPFLEGKSSDELMSLFQKFRNMGFSPTPNLRSKHSTIDFVSAPEIIDGYYQKLMKSIESMRAKMEMYDLWEFTKKSAREFSAKEKTTRVLIEQNAQVDDIVSWVTKSQRESFDSDDVNNFMFFLSNKLGSKVKGFKFSDVIRTNKKIGTSATLKADQSFVSELLTSKDKENWAKEIQKGFNLKDSSLDLILNEFDELSNFAIKKDGKTIGYYSLLEKDGVLAIYNYTVFPEYRGSQTSLNAILEVRDNVAKLAKEKGCQHITVNVDGNNPELLSLYRRFGFKEDYMQTMDYINDYGVHMQRSSYTLFQEVGCVA